jgi:(2Fe-2S) ferredoxin
VISAGQVPADYSARRLPARACAVRGYNPHLFAEASFMSFYKYHVFFCCNQREPGDTCCNNRGAQEVRDYAKDRVKALRLNGHGKVRINLAGCMDRCDQGPVMVVYPEGVWYTYIDKQDIDEIIDQHLRHGHVVERLRI